MAVVDILHPMASGTLPALPPLEKFLPVLSGPGHGGTGAPLGGASRAHAERHHERLVKEATALHSLVPDKEHAEYDELSAELTHPAPTRPPLPSSTTVNAQQHLPSVTVQSFLHTLMSDEHLPEYEEMVRRRANLTVARSTRDLKKAEGCMAMIDKREEEATIMAMCNSPLNDGESPGDRQERVDACKQRFQAAVEEYQRKKIELVVAEANLQAAEALFKKAEIVAMDARFQRAENIAEVTHTVKSFSSMIEASPREAFFVCDCDRYGLMSTYARVLTTTRTRWRAYPRERWFRYNDPRVPQPQVHCPLANLTVDLCDQSSYTMCGVVLRGNMILNSKVELAELLSKVQSTLAPPTFVLRGGCRADGTVEAAMVRVAAEHDPVWFLKDSEADYGRGITVLSSPLEYTKHLHSGRDYVLQAHVPRPLLYAGAKFHIRQYACLYFQADRGLQLMVYEQGWLAVARKAWVPYTSGAAEEVHVSRDRSLPWIEWEHYHTSFPILRDATRRCVRIARPKLLRMNQLGGAAVSKTRDAFELFGVDYMLDEEFQPTLLEFNTGPVVHETEERMIESMLSIVYPLGLSKADQDRQDEDDAYRWVPVNLDTV